MSASLRRKARVIIVRAGVDSHDHTANLRVQFRRLGPPGDLQFDGPDAGRASRSARGASNARTWSSGHRAGATELSINAA